MIAGSLRIKVEEKQELLEEVDVAKRLRRLSELLAREIEVMELGSKIQSQVQSEMDKTQREYFLRQQLKAIQEELGEEDETQAEINELREQIEEAELPEDAAQGRPSASWPARAAAARGGRVRRDPHLPRVDHLPALVASRPRTTSTSTHAREVLDEDHYDIEKVKERILEYLAVRKLKPDSRGSILSLRRPARRRQDLARQVDRARAGAQVRAHLGRRRARRGRDPRPPPHLHRRDAGHDHPRPPRRRSRTTPSS